MAKVRARVASKRAQRRKACAGKVRHAEEGHAYAALRRMRHAHQADNSHHSAYHCPHCGGWHIGHTPGRNHPNNRRT